METIPLDVRTLVLMNLLVSATLAALGLALGERSGRLQAVRLWGIALLAVSAGLLLHALRGPLPELIAVVAGNGFLLIAALYATRAARVLVVAEGVDRFGWMVVAGTMAGLAILYQLTPDLRPRGLLFSLAAAFLIGRAGLAFHSIASDYGRARLITAASLYCWAALHLLRAVYFAASPPWENFFASTAVAVLTLVLSSLFLIATTFGVLSVAVGTGERGAVRDQVDIDPPSWRLSEMLATPAAPAKAGSKGRILFVDDNADLRQTMAALLAHYEYETLLASNADAASAMLADQKLRPDAIVLDVVVPGTLSGLGLAEELRRTRPYLPVVLATGYSRLVKVPREEFEVIEKPYSIEELLAALERARDRIGEVAAQPGQPLDAARQTV